MDIVRKLRGIVTTAVIWSLAWAGVGALIALLYGRFAHATSILALPSIMALQLGIYGLPSGAVFATVVALTEGQPSRAEGAPASLVCWGILGAVLLPGWTLLSASFDPRVNTQFFDTLIPITLAAAVLGGCSAVAALAVVRRRPRGGEGTPPVELPTGPGLVLSVLIVAWLATYLPGLIRARNFESGFRKQFKVESVRFFSTVTIPTAVEGSWFQLDVQGVPDSVGPDLRPEANNIVRYASTHYGPASHVDSMLIWFIVSDRGDGSRGGPVFKIAVKDVH